jgi:hypothetical protein
MAEKKDPYRKFSQPTHESGQEESFFIPTGVGTGAGIIEGEQTSDPPVPATPRRSSSAAPKREEEVSGGKKKRPGKLEDRPKPEPRVSKTILLLDSYDKKINHLVFRARNLGLRGVSAASIIMARFEDIDPAKISDSDPFWESVQHVLASDRRRTR